VLTRASAVRASPLIAVNAPPAYSQFPETTSSRTSPQLIIAPNAPSRVATPVVGLMAILAMPRWATPLIFLNAPPM
jgi:hypothetical protein